MTSIEEILEQNKGKSVALYGLGTETERFLNEYSDIVSVVGLLDGFREDGELYGYPIIPVSAAIEMGISLIIVVARPGSCKAIAKRIAGMCRDKGIALIDIRGKDLLSSSEISYSFSGFSGDSKQSLIKKIQKSDVISFDLFDTLITRKLYSYTDIFGLIEETLKERGIHIQDFSKRRLFYEKELSKSTAPTLTEIYHKLLAEVGEKEVTAEYLVELEYCIDRSTIIPREDMCEVFRNSVSLGKRVVITTDSYYRKEEIESILEKCGITGYEALYVSCEYRTSKTQRLFFEIKSLTNKSILHVGDDEYADVEQAEKNDIEAFRIYSPTALMELLGEMGVGDDIRDISDRVKVGLFASNIFNSPFWFEEESRKVSVRDAENIGYLFCAPMITDFILWMKKKIDEQGYRQILFCARDGYLIERLYRKVDSETKSVYFLTSRTAAIRAGIESEEDIAYVDSMKYSGSASEALKKRFGLEEIDGKLRSEMILNKAVSQRVNYSKYIEKLGLYEEKMAMFDFVAKGTTQMYLARILPQDIKGYYFLQLEPEFMADKGLNIEPFYSDEEKNGSQIFENYYILETILTAPYSQLDEFDVDGNPRFASETRSEKDINCFERIQKGIEKYFEEYTALVPDKLRTENKRLDEILLSLINKIQILDNDFLALTVEDPFFGRMTDIKDVL